MSFRDWAVATFGEEMGGAMAGRYAEAMGRALDEAVFYGMGGDK